MKLLRRIVQKIALAYFNWQLDRKNHSALQGPWPTGSNSVSFGISDATCEVQGRLIREFGYHECPSCEWATVHPNEHLTEGSWCFEQYQETLFRRFYIVEKKLEQSGHFKQIGIVVAESVEHAAYKLRLSIVSVVRPPESASVCVELENNYWLEEIEKITSFHLSPRE